MSYQYTYSSSSSSSAPSSGNKGGFFSRFTKDKDPEPATAHVTQRTEMVRPTATGTTEGRTVSKETKTTTGPGGVTKTVVKETIIGPDGSKKVVTRETTSQGEGGATGSKSSDMDRRFRDLQIGRSSKPDKDEKKKKPQKLKDFIDDAVKAHNKARKKHGVPDFKHNKELDTLAQRWADHLSTTNVLKHSNDTYKGEQLGENVATKWTSTGEDYTGQEVVDQWYSENQKYNWNNQTFQSGTGHFTQVVWKGSKEVGIGKAVGSDGRVFVVGNYFPAGNVMGQFADNVVPARK